eukprot:486087_1
MIHELIDQDSNVITMTEQEHKKFIIPSKSSISPNTLNNISVFYAFCNSIVSVIDVISDYYVLYSWYKLSDNNTMYYLLIVSLVNIMCVQIYYVWIFVKYNFDKNKRYKTILYWLGILLLLIISPFLPFFDSLGYINKNLDFVNFLTCIGVPIYKRQKADLKMSSLKDEVRYWFALYFSSNKLIFIEIMFESQIQFMLQLIGLCIIAGNKENNNNYDLTELITILVSMIISLITIASKALVMNSYSIHRICILFNWLCWVTDLFGSVSLTLWMASLAVVNRNAFWYFIPILLCRFIISFIHALFCDKLQIRCYTLFGYILLFPIRLIFGLFCTCGIEFSR